MTPGWLNDTVRAFGRQMGLKDFRLQENGAAGARFENGFALRFEYADLSLVVSLGVPMAEDPESLKRLLMVSHPASARTARVRTAYLAKKGEAILAVRLAERDVSVAALEGDFRTLWNLATGLRRAVS